MKIIQYFYTAALVRQMQQLCCFTTQYWQLH